jgi:DNA-directed RNA polymerase subunit RPC12/RpoP
MGRFFTALKAGVAGFNEGTGPGEYQVAGRPVQCSHCGHQKFVSGRALLNTAGRTFMNLDWTDPSATTLICAECGRIEWFAQEPDRKSD